MMVREVIGRVMLGIGKINSLTVDRALCSNFHRTVTSMF